MEQPTITQILVSTGLASRGRMMESFAEYGVRDRPAVERRIEILARLRVDARRYHPLAAPVRVEGIKTMRRSRNWDARMAAPPHHQEWRMAWLRGRARAYQSIEGV